MRSVCVTKALIVAMSFLIKASLLLLLGAQTVSSTALDDYVWKADSNYNWVDLVSY